jgi:hypothetical protein
VVAASSCFLLTGHREVAYTLHISDDSCQVVDVLAVTLRTLLEIVLADMAALVADSVRNVESEVVTSFLCRNTQKLSVLSLRQVLL